MPRYTVCPYYIDENKLTISCEDVIRRFDCFDDKWGYMDSYCDAAWYECPYAANMNLAYEEQEKGDDKAVEKNKTQALETEVKGLHVKLGRAEKKIERMQKKIDELRSVNQSFINVNENLEKQKKEFYKRWRDAKDIVDKRNEELEQQIAKLVIIYEQRMCYLIEMYAPDKILVEDSVAEWAGDKEFALVHDADPEHGRYWKVVFKEDVKDKNVPDGE